MPSSNAVTTPQIVRTMKRGENGSISVSMGPLWADYAVLFFVRCKPNPTFGTMLYTISRLQVMDMTAPK
jgi:hypothetical protein